MCRGYSGIAALVSQRGVLDTKSRFKVDCGPDPPTAEACEDDSGKLGRVVVALEAGRGGMFPCSMISPCCGCMLHVLLYVRQGTVQFHLDDVQSLLP